MTFLWTQGVIGLTFFELLRKQVKKSMELRKLIKKSFQKSREIKRVLICFYFPSKQLKRDIGLKIEVTNGLFI